MSGGAALSLYVFGACPGESIILALAPGGESQSVYVIDSYATRQFDSPETNPIIGIESEVFTWEQVRGVCLTHAHEDHFQGLEAVASKTTGAQWLWPASIQIEKVLEFYREVASFKRSKTNPHRGWIVGSVEKLAEWSKGQSPIKLVSNRCIKSNGVIIRCLAPKDEICDAYVSQYLDSFLNELTNNRREPPEDFHNLPSAGLVVDTATGVRILLLGDMVKDSWQPIFNDNEVMKVLLERKADILKVPHHCSIGAVWRELLELICDPAKTRAVFTPFRLKTPPPHEEAVRTLLDYVKELWCTVSLPRAGDLWEADIGKLDEKIALRSFFSRPQTIRLRPRECMVLFEVNAAGGITTIPGKYAHCIKGRDYKLAMV